MGTRLYVVLSARKRIIIIRSAYACVLGLLHAAVVFCYSSIKTREPSSSPLTLHCSYLLQIIRVAIMQVENNDSIYATMSGDMFHSCFAQE